MANTRMIECMTSEPVVENKRNIESLINPTKETKGEKNKKGKKGNKKVEISPHALLTTINVHRLNLKLKERLQITLKT